MLFLSETHLDKAKAGKLRRRLGFDEMEVSESDGRSGGLVMLCQTTLGVSSRAVHSNYIEIRIKETTAAGWRFTGFYSEPSSDRKHLSWEYLRGLHTLADLPWIVGGDFDEILQAHEKEGGRHAPNDVCRLLAVP